MTKTKYYDLQMDDPQDDYDVEVVNANLEKIDEQMKTRENATDALQEPEFTVAEKRENIASKEKMPKILGKIAKFFTDLKTVAFSGKYSDLDGKPAIVNNNTATEAGSALDARQANPTIEGTMANQISQLNSDLLQKDHIDSSSTTTFSEFFMNQNAIFFVFASDGNNTVNKEIFGCNNDDYNNGFGAVILSVKMSMWRGFALAIPIRNWGIGCYIGQVENDSEFKWSKILTD
jgi:hypothetical protein